MANIKFSQFTVETAKADVDFLVGYSGADNVQISPANLLSDYPTFTGAVGQVAFFNSTSSIGGDNDLYWDDTNKRLGIGTSSPSNKLEIVGPFAATPLKVLRHGDYGNIINIGRNGVSETANIGYPADATINLSTAGSERMRITASGDVGIGTTTPSAKLDVQGTLIATGISQLGSGGNNVYLTSSSAGNVGIGTSSPLTKLNLANNSSGSVLSFKRNNSSTSGAKGGLTWVDSSNYYVAGISVSADGTTDNSGELIFRTSTGEADNIDLGYQVPERMRIDSSGNVGIGTTSPAEILDVNGNINIRSTTSGVRGIKRNDDGYNLHLAGGSSLTGGSYVEVNGGSRGGVGNAFNGEINFVSGGSYQSSQSAVVGNYNFKTQWNGGSAILMHIDSSSGNVGIGTTSPAAKLDVVGRIGLDDGNNNVSIGDNAGDALTTGSYNIAIGYNALTNEDTGERSVAIGYQALAFQNYNGLAYNVAVGHNAGAAVTTGIENVLIGGQTGDSITSGIRNVAIGHGALQTEDAHSYNVAIGNRALQAQNAGVDAYNVAVGSNAGQQVTTGINNTIIGGLAGDALTTGASNVAIGYLALSTEDAGSANIAIGHSALKDQDAGDAFNTAIGYYAGKSVTTGTHNVLLGGLAGDALTTGSANIAIGFEALSTEDGHSQNVAIGYRALKMLNAGTAGLNVAVGHQAGTAMTTGVQNVLIGGLAGDSLTLGSENVAIGYNSLGTEDGNGRNVAIGYRTLEDQNAGIDAYNVAVGYSAGKEVTTGIRNTLIGGLAGGSLTTGSNNIAIGIGSLQTEDGHGRNIAIGSQALSLLNAGADAYNVAIGYEAGKLVSTGVNNIIIGGLAGDALTTGGNNTAVGYSALGSEDAHGNNTAIGVQTLLNLNAGTDGNNTAVGHQAGLSISTGTRNTLIGSLAGDALTTGGNNIIVGFNAEASAVGVSNEITLGNSSISTLRCQVTTITSLSDKRDKENIQPSNYGLDLINKLKPVTFDWNMRDGGKVGIKDLGFIAQDLQEVDDENLKLVYDSNPEKLEASYGRLVPVLVKAIQELKQEIEQLKNKH